MTPRHAARRLRRALRRAGRPDLQRIVLIGGHNKTAGWVPFTLRSGHTRPDITAVLAVAAQLDLDTTVTGDHPEVPDNWWAYYKSFDSHPLPHPGNETGQATR